MGRVTTVQLIDLEAPAIACRAALVDLLQEAARATGDGRAPFHPVVHARDRLTGEGVRNAARPQVASCPV